MQHYLRLMVYHGSAPGTVRPRRDHGQGGYRFGSAQEKGTTVTLSVFQTPIHSLLLLLSSPSSSLCRSSRANYSRMSWRSNARSSRSRWKRLSLSCAWRDLSCISSISWTRSSRVSAGAGARARGCDGRPREATNTGHLTEAPLPMART